MTDSTLEAAPASAASRRFAPGSPARQALATFRGGGRIADTAAILFLALLGVAILWPGLLRLRWRRQEPLDDSLEGRVLGRVRLPPLAILCHVRRSSA